MADGVIACPKCRFVNRSKDERCIVCKTPLRPEEDVITAMPVADAPKKRPRDDDRTTSVKTRKDLLAGVSKPDAGSLLRPPTPAAAKAAPPAGADAVAWLHCDPIAPYPVGPSREVRVGRGDTNELVLPHRDVSRTHAIFRARDKQLLVEDRGSSNGTLVNGRPAVGETAVRIGDVVGIGPYEIEIWAVRELPQQDPGRTQTSVRSLLTGASFSGKLEEVPPLEILSQLAFHERTGTLSLVDANGAKGTVWLEKARVLSVAWKQLRDAEALAAIVGLKAGLFAFSSELPGSVERTLSRSIASCLKDLLGAVDDEDDDAPPVDEE